MREEERDEQPTRGHAWTLSRTDRLQRARNGRRPACHEPRDAPKRAQEHRQISHAFYVFADPTFRAASVSGPSCIALRARPFHGEVAEDAQAPLEECFDLLAAVDRYPD